MAQECEDITELLRAWGHGDRQALERLMPLVYDRLHQLASGFLRYERANHTLQSSALVHEAYLRMVALDRVSWQDRAHFFALSARFMRRILIDHARRIRSRKRGQGQAPVPLEAVKHLAAEQHPDLLALDHALLRLAEQDPQQARIVELRYFGGLDREEIALVLGISSATVTRRWRMARAWLYRQLRQCDREDPAAGDPQDPTGQHRSEDRRRARSPGNRPSC